MTFVRIVKKYVIIPKPCFNDPSKSYLIQQFLLHYWCFHSDVIEHGNYSCQVRGYRTILMAAYWCNWKDIKWSLQKICVYILDNIHLNFREADILGAYIVKDICNNNSSGIYWGASISGGGYIRDIIVQEKENVGFTF